MAGNAPIRRARVPSPGVRRGRPRPAALDEPPPASRPVRVLHLVGCLDRGGAETVSLDLCRSIPPAEFTQLFVTVAGWEGSLAGDFRAAGAPVRQCPLAPLPSFPGRLWRLLRAVRPDVVVSHLSLAGGAVLLVARAAGVPVRVARMWSEGDAWRDTVARRARRGVLRRVLRHAATDVLGVTSSALRFAGPPAGDPRYRVLYNSVDPARVDGWEPAVARRRWGLPPDVPVLAYLGRSIPDKNRPFLVDVHRAARERDPRARLLVVGPGGTGDLTAAHPGIVDDPLVVLGGEVREIGSVLAAADVLLLPSRREGLPGVILEALAAGLPAVATDLSCLREVSRHVRGLTLLPLDDGPRRWAEVALELTRLDPVRRGEIRESLASSPFLIDDAARQWRSLWRAGAR